MVEIDLFTAVAVGVIIILCYHYIAQKYLYFLTKPVPCLKPTFLLGNFASLLFRRKDIVSHLITNYNAFPDAKISGFFDFIGGVYLLRDPEMINKICVKDFDFFTDRTPILPLDQNNDYSLLGNSLFAMRGQKWREMRATLSPAFTGSKMRQMFQLVASTAQSLTAFFTAEARKGVRLEYEMKDMFSRFANDVVATVAFGMEMDSVQNRDNEFYLMGKKLVDFSSITILFKFFIMQFIPSLANKLKFDLFDAKATEYFKSIIVGNMARRQAQGIVRNDMIQMLMEVRRGTLKHLQDELDSKDAGFATVQESSVGKSTHSRVWSENELIAQCFLFFFAGFETTSTCITFLSYEILANPEVQKRLYEEIIETEKSLNGEPLTYETLQKMQYLDMVISEALRMWPPNLHSERFCNKDYQFDDGVGTRFTIEKGRSILIPTIAIQRDPKYYLNPERFDPERFNEENRSSINPNTYLPFGIGPRNCIGSRLALMEVKVIMYYLLKDFSLEPTEKTQIPLRVSKKRLTLHTEGVWLEFRPRASKEE
ncbi:probable cytochrome P450 9f2 [Wyeomyia smithii]|uniref:probable cytochrome P450 9f2 n=1 Tax=Wyeomyia smithii TaxID=174621 RepID=UPI002467D6F7|nr:probable cytochrome P450 9f2 [Wyeomyia smithii]